MALESGESWSFTNSNKTTEATSRPENYHLKIWISTLIKLPKHSQLESTALFANRSITHVEIFGTIVDRISLSKADVYTGMMGKLTIKNNLKNVNTCYSG